MNCHEAGIWLGAYADSHVGALRRYSIQRHLRACTGCAEKHQGLLALRARLRAEAPYFKAPPELRARLQARFADTRATTTLAARAQSPRARPDQWLWLAVSDISPDVLTAFVQRLADEHSRPIPPE